MTHANSGTGNSVQQAWSSAGPVKTDASPANNRGESATSYAAIAAATPATAPAPATGNNADTASPFRVLDGDVQRLLLALQSMQASGGSDGSPVSADHASAGASRSVISNDCVIALAAGAAATVVGCNDTITFAEAASQPTVPVSPASSFTAQVVGSEAGYDSSYGYYVTDANGNPVSGGILFPNVKDGGTATVTVPGVDPSHIGFFIIPNGADDNVGLTKGEPVTFQQINGQWAAVNASNQVIGGSGANLLFDSQALNGDGVAHAEDNPTIAGNQNWEDIYGGGDRDFNDVNVNLSWNAAPTVTSMAEVLFAVTEQCRSAMTGAGGPSNAP